MELRKIVWWLVLVYSYDKMSAFDILNKPTPTPHFQMEQLFISCYSDRSNPIVITNNLIDIIDELQVGEINFPVMTIDPDFKAKNMQIFIPAYPLYIVSTDSTAQLQGLLNELKSTLTWNIVSTFFFIEAAENNCQNASQVLQLLWKFELLSSFYFCIEPNNDIMLFTYNPYTSRAPDSWTGVDTNDKPDNRWTLYKQLYSPNDNATCQSLAYDKTKALDGYEVKAIGTPLSWNNITRNGTYDMTSLKQSMIIEDYLYIESLFSGLNVTPLMNYDDYGSYSHKTAKGFIKSIINGSHDIGFNSRVIDEEAYEVVDIIDLNYQNGYLVLSQYKRFEVSVEEVGDFYDIVPGVALFVVVMVVTFITIALNTDNDYAQAFLDILRMILGFGILAPIERFSMRICFVLSFIIIFCMNPAIEGQISSLLSKPDQRNVESLKDVYDQQYDLYYFTRHERYILSLNFWSKSSDGRLLHPVEYAIHNCSEIISHDSFAACVAYSTFQLSQALKYDLHVTKTLELTKYFTYWVKKNWALKDRINQITSRMTEAGLLIYWDKPTFYWPMKRIKALDKIDFYTEVEQFELENMRFAYLFFGLSIFLAIIIFALEKFINKIRPRRELRLQQRVVIFNRRVHIINEWV